MDPHTPATNIGTPQCPHCHIEAAGHPEPIGRLEVYKCGDCDKTYVILNQKIQYTTFPTALTEHDLEGH